MFQNVFSRTTSISSKHSVPLPPGAWLGLIGGGQLGRMFCLAAKCFGYRVFVLDPGNNTPASSLADRYLVADYGDTDALSVLAEACTSITVEFENVPADSIRFLEERCTVCPAVEGIRIAQDRILEKRFICGQGFDTAPYLEIFSTKDIDSAPNSLFPGVLKLARLGYDGKGQMSVASAEEARDGFLHWGQYPCVLEKKLELQTEISVVLARGFHGEVAVFPPTENVHCNGILIRSRAPCLLKESADAVLIAQKLAEGLGYVGVFCVEFFVASGGKLFVNEMAPRPHNSGHYTIDACLTSQFEQQVRIMAGWPLGETTMNRCAVMLNILGDCCSPNEGPGLKSGNETNLFSQLPPDWMLSFSHPKLKFHWYGKTSAFSKRKMGHVTILADSLVEADLLADQVQKSLSPLLA